MFFEAYANLVYDVHATAGLTLIVRILAEVPDKCIGSKAL